MSRTSVVLTLIAVIGVGAFLGAGETLSSKAADAPGATTALSTHVLDSASGSPVGGIPVRLEREGEVLGQGKTDKDGRA